MDQLFFTVIGLCVTVLGGTLLGWIMHEEHETHTQHAQSGQHPVRTD